MPTIVKLILALPTLNIVLLCILVLIIFLQVVFLKVVLAWWRSLTTSQEKEVVVSTHLENGELTQEYTSKRKAKIDKDKDKDIDKGKDNVNKEPVWRIVKSYCLVEPFLMNLSANKFVPSLLAAIWTYALLGNSAVIDLPKYQGWNQAIGRMAWLSIRFGWGLIIAATMDIIVRYQSSKILSLPPRTASTESPRNYVLPAYYTILTIITISLHLSTASNMTRQGLILDISIFMIDIGILVVINQLGLGIVGIIGFAVVKWVGVVGEPDWMVLYGREGRGIVGNRSRGVVAVLEESKENIVNFTKPNQLENFIFDLNEIHTPPHKQKILKHEFNQRSTPTNPNPTNPFCQSSSTPYPSSLPTLPTFPKINSSTCSSSQQKIQQLRYLQRHLQPISQTQPPVSKRRVKKRKEIYMVSGGEIDVVRVKNRDKREKEKERHGEREKDGGDLHDRDGVEGDVGDVDYRDGVSGDSIEMHTEVKNQQVEKIIVSKRKSKSSFTENTFKLLRSPTKDKQNNQNPSTPNSLTDSPHRQHLSQIDEQLQQDQQAGVKGSKNFLTEHWQGDIDGQFREEEVLANIGNRVPVQGMKRRKMKGSLHIVECAQSEEIQAIDLSSYVVCNLGYVQSKTTDTKPILDFRKKTSLPPLSYATPTFKKHQNHHENIDSSIRNKKSQTPQVSDMQQPSFMFCLQDLSKSE